VTASDTQSTGTSSSEATGMSWLAIGGFVTGILVVVAFLGEWLSPNPPNQGTLNFVASQSDLNLYAFRSFGWALYAIAAVPFFAMLGATLRPRNAQGASAAMMLTIVGVVLYALRGILMDAGWVAAGTLAPPTPMDASYQFWLLTVIATPLMPLGTAMLGLGLILFGILARSSGLLPNWVCYVAFAAGVAGWLVFPALNYGAGDFIGYFFTETLLPFLTAVFCFACGAIFLRRARLMNSGSAPSPSGTS